MKKRLPNSGSWKRKQEFWDTVLLSPEDEWIKQKAEALVKSRNSVYVTLNGKIQILSRFIMKPSPHLVVDHINRNILDNRRENLRICTQSQNNKNRKISDVMGVRKAKRKLKKSFQAYGNINGKFIHLGYYMTLEEASAVRDVFELQNFGEFAVLNNVSKAQKTKESEASKGN